VAVDGTDGSTRAAEFVDRLFAGMDVRIKAVNVARVPSEALCPVPYGGVFAWPSVRTTEEELVAHDEAMERERQEAVRAA
jgi:hypothetical protein